MDCPGRSEVAVARLPDDALVEILSRLPAKPLFRFKCVSKAWCDLIAGRLRRNKFPQTLEGFFHGGVEAYGNFTSLSGRSTPLVDPSFSFLTKLPGVEHIVLFDSRNGLFLFGRTEDGDTIGYIVCNPATEQWVAVPSSYWIGSAREESDDEFDNFMDLGREARTFLILPDDLLHFLVNHFGHYQKPQEPPIVAVDGQGRTCRIIRWLDESKLAAPFFIGQSQGRLHCISAHQKLHDRDPHHWTVDLGP